MEDWRINTWKNNMKRDGNLQLVRVHLTPLMKHLQGLKYYFYGGCIRDLFSGKLPNDYDIGCETAESLNELVARLQSNGWVLELETSYGLKFKYLNNIIDVSTSDVMKPEDKISKFDFTINAIAYTSDNICMFHNSSFDDISEMKILPLKDYEDGDEVIADRAIKFWKDGYKSKSHKLKPPVDFILSSVYVSEISHYVFDVR